MLLIRPAHRSPLDAPLDVVNSKFSFAGLVTSEAVGKVPPPRAHDQLLTLG